MTRSERDFLSAPQNQTSVFIWSMWNKGPAPMEGTALTADDVAVVHKKLDWTKKERNPLQQVTFHRKVPSNHPRMTPELSDTILRN
jgi:hypothetical protein